MPFWSRRPPEESPSWDELFPLEALLGIIEGRSGDDQSFATTTSEHAQREQSLEETG